MSVSAFVGIVFAIVVAQFLRAAILSILSGISLFHENPWIDEGWRRWWRTLLGFW